VTVTRAVPIVKVSNIPVALEFYCSTLGFVIDFRYEASADGPWYAGVSRDGCQIPLSTFAGDGVLGTATYFYVDDVDALHRAFRQAGLKLPANPESPVDDGPVNQTWGMREFYVRDPDGNTLRFGSPVPPTG